MQEKVIRVGEALSFAWARVRGNLAIVLGTILVYASVEVVTYILQKMSEGRQPVGLVVALFSYAVSMVMQIGLIKIALKLHDAQEVRVEDLYMHARLFFKFFAASLLVGLITILGLFLLIVPGIVWGIKFSLSAYLVVDKEAGPIEALKKSSVLTSGFKGQLCVLYLVIMLLNIAGLLALMLGMLITIPLTMVAQAYAYRLLSARINQGQNIAAQPQ